jgi:hypothetical protein
MLNRRALSQRGKAVDEAAIEKFRGSLQGDLIRPGDQGYDTARKIFNAMIDRRPSLIARCAGLVDVIGGVNFARDYDLVLAVRGGGHNVAGNAVCDGGIVVDLSLMKGIRVDPTRRTVRAEGGVTYGELDRATQLHGLATTGGEVSTTGIAGLTLGGGFGWLMGKHGLACDNLLSVEIVTAEGKLITANAEQNSDLFWGIRGGGGNFGIVTSFEYRLHPVGELLAGMVMWPLAKGKEILSFYRHFAKEAPDELNTLVTLLTDPQGAAVVAIGLCYAGSVTQGEKVVGPLRALGPPLADLVRPMAYCEVQRMIDAADPPGLQNYWKSNFLRGLTDAAIESIISHFEAVTSPRTEVIIEHLHGAVSRVDQDETAFNHRDAEFSFLIDSKWADPAESEKHIRWTRDYFSAMESFYVGGAYINYLGDEGEDRVKAAYGAAKYQRLAALKKTYDPTNLFHLNQNIRPAV